MHLTRRLPFTTGRGQGADGDWRSGSLAFRRGWIASTRPVPHDIADEWQAVQLGPLTVRVHPALGWASATRGDSGALVLGDPVDLNAATARLPEIARRVAQSADPVRHVAALGGRYTCLVHRDRRVTVIPDCVASMPVYWHRAGDTAITLSSHSHLLGEAVGAEVDETISGFMRTAKAGGARGTLYWPGVETPFRGVLAVLPNHVLTVDGTSVEHTRFYPFPDTDLPTDPDDAYEQFSDLFTTHVRLLCGLGRTGISLTAGLDSRATFAAARRHLPHDALTWTYYKFQAPDLAMQEDLLTANSIATRARVPHRIVSVERASGDYSAAYTRTFRHTQQFRALSEAYRAQLPGDIVELQSMVAEVGTGFYKHRDEPYSVARLSRLYASGEHGRAPAITTALEHFIEYGDFTPARFGPVDYHDLFYWESRIGRWGTLRMQEVDLAHRIVLPYNARGIVEALQGPRLADRSDKQALSRLIGED